MRRIDWTQGGIDDLRKAEAYLTDFSPDIARDVIERAVTAGRFLLDFPSIGTPLGRGRWRKWRAPKTRYLLIYRPIRGGIEIGHVRYDRSDWTLVPS